MTSDLLGGEVVYIDRALRAEFVRYLSGGAEAIVRVGPDTRVVSALTLSRLEA